MSKLIRDKIPEIMDQLGKKYEIYTASETEFKTALFEKALEEAEEILKSLGNPENTKEEIADLYEVLDAIIKIEGFSKEEIIEIQTQKRNKKGAFSKKIILTKW